MPDALDRVRARVEAHTAAAVPPVPAPQAPANTPPEPVAPPEDQANIAQQVADHAELIVELSDRVAVLEQAEVDDAMGELDAWAEPGMMAALPAPAPAPKVEA